MDLPFGLILKSSNRTSKEEAASIQMTRATEQPNEPYNRFWSMLMTRLSGILLENSYGPLDVNSEEPWLFEFRNCIIPMREWVSPYAERI
ncbi:uncharacterized protein N7469_000195 [Penicillium citrinum]|uniref:Uncharacterized protein n=1 Tax=Penicillium citrinum TaxID=5077 RepID=A0A9W9TUN2_PENCI|nr:uncharacterized protein N7469_000195 [Penicillium citrinum]KAJ5241868.1 hypothetical protein N7469_000195 [Penicillium citrinum]